MTDTALSATLFGAEDLRLVEAPTRSIRARHGPGALRRRRDLRVGHALLPTWSDRRFRCQIPLSSRSRDRGRDRGHRRRRPGPQDRRPRRSQPSRWCGHCARCQEGRPNLCENIYFMGSASKTPHMQGGFATYFDAVPAQCVKVSDSTPMAAAALAEPLAVCLHAIGRAGQVRGAESNCIWRRSDRSSDVAGRPIGRSIGGRDGRRSCRSACLRAASWR